MKVVYCTIASANYLPRVKVLADSLAAHQSNASLQVLLCEWPERCRELSVKTGFRFLSPAEVCADWREMAFTYDITEFNTALKPFLLDYLLRDRGDAVFYFDPDIEIFGSLEALENLAAQHALILTPHVCEPLYVDGLRPSIDDIIKVGQFNLGFIGLARDAEVFRALRWWQEICVEHCIVDPEKGYFVDQFWAAALPSFIQNFHCLRAPEYNVAYWNVFQRPLERLDDSWSCQGRPLKFFHFSGLPDDDLTQVSRHQNRVSAAPGSALHTLLSAYLKKTRDNAWCGLDQQAYSFAHFTNGQEISKLERRSLLAMPRAMRRQITDPFAGNFHDLIPKPQRKAMIGLLHGLAARLGDFAVVAERHGLAQALSQAVRYVVRALTRRAHD